MTTLASAIKDAPPEQVAATRGHIVALLGNEHLEGYDIRVLTECDALVQAGYEVTVVCWDRTGKRPPVTYVNGARVVALRTLSRHDTGLRQLGPYLRFAWEALRWQRRQPIFAIHCHDLDTLPIGWLIGKLRRRPVVFDAHEAYPEMQSRQPGRSGLYMGVLRFLERFLASRSTYIITIGLRMRERFVKITKGRVPVAVVGSWREPRDFAFTDDALDRERQRLGLEKADLVVGFFGGLNTGKPVLPLLQAAKRIGRIKVLLGGDGEHADMVRNWAKENPWIHYFGMVPWEKVCLYSKLSDVIFYGLRMDAPDAALAAPNTPFIALGAGKPLITTEVGEIAEIVRQTGCGYLMPDNSDAACEAGLKHFLDRHTLEQTAECARNASKIYCAAESQRRLLLAYEDLKRIQ